MIESSVRAHEANTDHGPPPAPSSAEDEWHTELVDVQAYLRRIDHPRVAPTAEALRSLQAAHLRAIPFENVDVVLGSHRGLSLDVIEDKLVRRQRGGYCYEHALLFAAVAERLGFPVRRLLARVQPHRAGPQTHMTLAVRAEEVDYLVDVGFGAGVLAPMPLRDGVEVDQAGWPHRLTHADGVWTLAKHTPEGWQPRHAFDESVRRPVDYEIAHHYVSTHPASPFTARLVVMRIEPGVSRRLVDRELTVEHSDGRVRKTPVSLEALDSTLRGLGVVLDPDEMARLRARLAGESLRWAG